CMIIVQMDSTTTLRFLAFAERSSSSSDTSVRTVWPNPQAPQPVGGSDSRSEATQRKGSCWLVAPAITGALGHQVQADSVRSHNNRVATETIVGSSRWTKWQLLNARKTCGESFMHRICSACQRSCNAAR